MKLPIILHRLAQRELDLAVDWYEDRRRGLGERFNNRVLDVMSRISDNPYAFAESEDRVREARVPRFPYCIYFRVESERIQVVSVFHTSRDPESWKNRT